MASPISKEELGELLQLVGNYERFIHPMPNRIKQRVLYRPTAYEDLNYLLREPHNNLLGVFFTALIFMAERPDMLTQAHLFSMREELSEAYEIVLRSMERTNEGRQVVDRLRTARLLDGYRLHPSFADLAVTPLGAVRAMIQGIREESATNIRSSITEYGRGWRAGTSESADDDSQPTLERPVGQVLEDNVGEQRRLRQREVDRALEEQARQVQEMELQAWLMQMLLIHQSVEIERVAALQRMNELERSRQIARDMRAEYLYLQGLGRGREGDGYEHEIPLP